MACAGLGALIVVTPRRSNCVTRAGPGTGSPLGAVGKAGARVGFLGLALFKEPRKKPLKERREQAVEGAWRQKAGIPTKERSAESDASRSQDHFTQELIREGRKRLGARAGVAAEIIKFL